MNVCPCHVKNTFGAVNTPIGRQLLLNAPGSPHRCLHSSVFLFSRSRSYPGNRNSENVDNERAPAHRPRPKLEDTQDIYVEDLDATLEAHRATNRAKKIRRIHGGTDPAVKHLVLDKSSKAAEEQVVEASVVKVASSTGESKALQPSDFWPHGSRQHQKLVKSSSRLTKESIKEYYARAMIPVGTWERPSEECGHTDGFCPWLKHLSGPGGDGLQRLGHEIAAFEQYMTPSAAELNAHKKVVSQIQQVISSTLDQSFCEVIGSHRTGLAMPWSGIDVAVTLPAIQKEAATHQKSLHSREYRKVYRTSLFKLKEAFSQDPNFNVDPKLIMGHIPLTQATHRATGVDVQIQMQAGSRHQHQYPLAYLAEYPTLRPLYFIIRSCLELRRLNIRLEGGLGSYAILMLIVNALKHAPGRYDSYDVASQLLHVLDFYAKSDLYHDGFSVDPPRTFRKVKPSLTAEERMLRAADPVLRGIDSMASSNPQRPYLLCLQNPADPQDDLGRKAYAIKHIQATFGMARETIKGAMEAWDRRSDLTSDKGAKLGLLDALVGGNYKQFNSDRHKVEMYGFSNPDVDAPDRSGRITAQEMLTKVIEMDKRKAAEVSATKSEESGQSSCLKWRILSNDDEMMCKQVQGQGSRDPDTAHISPTKVCDDEHEAPTSSNGQRDNSGDIFLDLYMEAVHAPLSSIVLCCPTRSKQNYKRRQTADIDYNLAPTEPLDYYGALASQDSLEHRPYVSHQSRSHRSTSQCSAPPSPVLVPAHALHLPTLQCRDI
ncbi:MAG: hypothetical protein Q9173_001342 [Seirophora scorigena]